MTSPYAISRLSAARPFPRAPILCAAAATLGLGLSGCGGWFGDDETLLPGERVSVRTATADAEIPRTEVPLPAAKTLTNWPQDGGAASRAVTHVAADFALERVWTASVGLGSTSEARLTSPPVAQDGRAFALDADSQLTAIDLATGDRLWDVDLTPDNESSRDGFGGGVAVVGDMAIVTTGFGKIHGVAVDTGEIKWTTDAPGPIRSAPAVSGGVAVVSTREGQVLGLGVADGFQIWRHDGVPAEAAMLGGGAPAISGDVVASPFATGEVGIFRRTDGRLGWLETLGSPRRGAPLSVISDVSSAPVMQEGVIFAGGVSGRLAAFDIPTGRRIWGRDLGSYNRVWAAESVVFVVTVESQLHALDARTGATFWRTDLPRFADPDDREEVFTYGGPVLAGGKLYLTSSAELLYEIDGRTGEILRRVDLPGRANQPPIIASGLLLILDDDANLHAYR